MQKIKDKSEICLIAPTDQLAKRARTIIKQKELNIEVYTAALDGAAEIAEGLMQQGTWLFISRKGTKEFLERKLGITVVDITLAASDYIPAIQKAQKETGKIAFFTVEEPSDELKTICFLLNFQACYYRFSDEASCEKCVDQAISDGTVLGIGGVVSGRYAEKRGLSYFLVESSDEAISHALETASQIYRIHKENEKAKEQLQIQLERYKNILNYTHDAIITINDLGQIEVINKVAEQMISQTETQFEGKLIEDVLPNTKMNEVLRTGKIESNQLMSIKGTMVSTNRVPIIVNNKIKGVVATFRDIKSLQKAEINIRVKLHEKGLVAKYSFSDIIGSSEILNTAKELAQDFADSQFTVMIYGETGTGKEMFAQSIHNASPRKSGPFVAVNCTALSKSLLESELFGYADGSFTGAKRGGKPGVFEIAHNGTVFLDEIGDLPLEFQAQFLRVIQEKEVRRVGGDNIIPVDIRVIGATNRELMELVEEGKFRRDLYYRLNVLNLKIPPLKSRGDDYLQIAEKIYKKSTGIGGQDKQQDFRALMEGYRQYSWPGNVRELHNIVERICLLQKRGLANDKILEAMQMMVSSEQNEVIVLQEKMGLSELESERINEALKRNNGNISRTAKELKISRSTLYRKIK